jgi:hypothetical protein
MILKRASLAASGQPVTVIGHQGVLPPAIILQDVPAEDSGVMAIIENQSDCIIPHRLDAGDADILFAARRCFLTNPVTLHLGRR